MSVGGRGQLFGRSCLLVTRVERKLLKRTDLAITSAL